MKMDEQASLFEAAMSSSIKDSVYKKPIMKLLLDHGADVNHKSLNGNVSLFCGEIGRRGSGGISN
jgi:hypothetical protein